MMHWRAFVRPVPLCALIQRPTNLPSRYLTTQHNRGATMIPLILKCVMKSVSLSNGLSMKLWITRALVLMLTLPFGRATAQDSNSVDQRRSLPEAPSPVPSMDLRSASSMAASQRFEARLCPAALSQAPTQEGQSQQDKSAGQKPVGTAAAPYEKSTGVAGSRPAGAAIAPGKQKRAHSIVIKVGVIAAAGVATGTVIGLSRASHSRP